MIQVKNKVAENLKTISNAQSLDEIFYTLYLKIKLAKSEDDIKNDRVMSIEESRERMKGKYETYNL